MVRVAWPCRVPQTQDPVREAFMENCLLHDPAPRKSETWGRISESAQQVVVGSGVRVLGPLECISTERGFNNTHLSLRCPRGRGFCRARLPPRPQGRDLPASSSSWVLQVSLGWWPCPSISACVFPRPLLCVFVQMSPFLGGHQSLALRPTRLQHDLSVS